MKIPVAILTALGISLSAPVCAREVPSYTLEELTSSGFLPEDATQTHCPGRPATLRLVKLKEGGTFAGFREAVAAHSALLQKHGVHDHEYSSFIGFLDAEHEQYNRLAVGALFTYPNMKRWAEIRAHIKPFETGPEWEEMHDKYKRNVEGVNESLFFLCLSAKD